MSSDAFDLDVIRRLGVLERRLGITEVKERPVVSKAVIDALGINADTVDTYHGWQMCNGLWVPASAFQLASGAPVRSYIAGAGVWDAYDTWYLVDAATNGVRCTAIVPSAWNGKTLNFRWVFAAESAVAGNFLTNKYVRVDSVGALLTGNGTNSIHTTAAPGVAKTRFDLTYSIVAPVTALDVVRMTVYRIGADAADTAAGWLHFLGVLLSAS